MTLEQFRDSLSHDEPPRQLSVALSALWWDAKHNWKQAHDIAGQDEGPAAAWVHAYLHRKEGDLGNAGYWYRRADRVPATGSLEQEWLEIARSLLAGTDPVLTR
jgi:hypothetical protein